MCLCDWVCGGGGGVCVAAHQSVLLAASLLPPTPLPSLPHFYRCHDFSLVPMDDGLWIKFESRPQVSICVHMNTTCSRGGSLPPLCLCPWLVWCCARPVWLCLGCVRGVGWWSGGAASGPPRRPSRCHCTPRAAPRHTRLDTAPAHTPSHTPRSEAWPLQAQPEKGCVYVSRWLC